MKSCGKCAQKHTSFTFQTKLHNIFSVVWQHKETQGGTYK